MPLLLAPDRVLMLPLPVLSFNVEAVATFAELTFILDQLNTLISDLLLISVINIVLLSLVT